MSVRTVTLTIPAGTPAGTTVDVPVPHGYATVRVRGVRAVAPALDGATRGDHAVYLSSASGSPSVWVDFWSILPADQAGAIAFTGGTYLPGTSGTVRGSIADAVGSPDAPLSVLYVNSSDVAQTGAVRVDLVLEYEE